MRQLRLFDAAIDRKSGKKKKQKKEANEMNTKGFSRRLERLEAGVQLRNHKPTLEFVNDSTRGGLTSVVGPDGEDVWWNPPAGCKVGEPLGDSGPRLGPGGIPDGFRIVFYRPTDRNGILPTTEIGPDGRLVWAVPPDGSKAGEAIEDHPTRSLCETFEDPELNSW